MKLGNDVAQKKNWIFIPEISPLHHQSYKHILPLYNIRITSSTNIPNKSTTLQSSRTIKVTSKENQAILCFKHQTWDPYSPSNVNNHNETKQENNHSKVSHSVSEVNFKISTIQEPIQFLSEELRSEHKKLNLCVGTVCFVLSSRHDCYTIFLKCCWDIWKFK